MRRWYCVAVRVQVPKKASAVRFILNPIGKILLVLLVVGATTGFGVFTYYYVKYSRLIDAKLAAGPFANTSMLFAAPRTVDVGDVADPEEIASDLRRSGYTESPKNPMGYFTLKPDEIDVYPGPDSYFKRDEGVIKFAGHKVAHIISLADNTDRTEYILEPELISNLFDKNREKRRMVRYEDIPRVLVNAVVSAEDKRFFQHSGFDPVRVIKSAYVDVKKGQNAQGASTLSMQLAGMWMLNRSDRSWKRKIPEVLITMHLEQKLTKKQIFEDYANQVPLGQRGSFGIRGFGEASQVFFGKDISQLTLPEAATLAGVIQHPSYINPFRWPDRAKTRRNLVLKMMRENNYISDEEYQRAIASPMVLVKQGMDSAEAPYFVDLVNDTLVDKFPDYNFQSNTYRVYTTLDPNLQRDAAEAVRIGMEEADKRIKGRKKRDPNYPDPQCALIALDPQTGEVRALIGGRNYGTSQLNRILAKRQPGSSFKPFVYAAALNTGLSAGQVNTVPVNGGPASGEGNAGQVITPATMITDEPTTFYFDGKPYQPSNFEHKFYGNVSLRDALAHSLNVATVKLAEQTGYDTIVDLARRAGMNVEIHPTPAVALGAYEVTPLEIAGAYTIFANHGVYSKPYFVSDIASDHGSIIYDNKPEHKDVLDPRVAFLMDQLLEEVVRTGTGAGVGSRGINFPIAGKTGTSHDGWFAGFTSKLICIVWVGFDDNRELNLEGAHSALPVWAEFMKRAHEHREYHNVSEFGAPTGVVGVQIDPASGQLATAACPKVRTEYFIEGTQPSELCQLHGGGGMRVAGWDTGQPARASDQNPSNPPGAGASSGVVYLQPRVAEASPSPESPSQPQAQPKRKGFFDRLRGIFK
jgi:penicillin-binding protein 1B